MLLEMFTLERHFKLLARKSKAEIQHKIITMHCNNTYSLQLLNALLACGVPVDVRDSSEANNTLLHWAGSYSTVQIVRTLCGKLY